MRCGICNQELNKSYLRSHVKKQHYNQDDKCARACAASHNDEAQEHSQLRTINNTGGDLLPTQLSTKLNIDKNNNDNNNNDDDNNR